MQTKTKATPPLLSRVMWYDFIKLAQSEQNHIPTKQVEYQPDESDLRRKPIWLQSECSGTCSSDKLLVCAGLDSRLALWRVLWDGNGVGGIHELRRSGSRHHGQHSRSAAATQAIQGHHAQQVLPVPLQLQPRGHHLP